MTPEHASASFAAQRRIIYLLVLFCTLFFSPLLRGQTPPAPAGPGCADQQSLGSTSGEAAGGSSGAAPADLKLALETVSTQSFPELRNKVVKTRSFQSSADYFRTRFSVSRFLLWRRMHYFVEMNPRIAASGPARESVCAILAHELAHIAEMSHGNRLHLFGLVRLVSKGYSARFERSADLEAIRRGYGPGLAGYREWVYKNIPAGELPRKRRNYFSPEEIAAILRFSETKQELFSYWKKHVPLNLEQIQSSANAFPKKPSE